MEKLTQITLAWELFEQGVPKSHIATHLGRSRETVIRWIAAIQEQGLLAFLEHHRQAPKQPRPARQVAASTERLVWGIRERDCGGQKIAYFLEREHRIRLSVPKIYEVLAERFIIRSKGKKNAKRGDVPTADAARQVVQMDPVDFGQVFAFTAVDIFSREADVLLRPSLTARDGLAFLERSMARRFGGRVALLQTDGGSEFEAEFSEAAPLYCQRHRIARPYKKNEQALIESFNRTVRTERHTRSAWAGASTGPRRWAN